MSLVDWCRYVHSMGVVARWYLLDGGTVKGFVEAMSGAR